MSVGSTGVSQLDDIPVTEVAQGGEELLIIASNSLAEIGGTSDAVEQDGGEGEEDGVVVHAITIPDVDDRLKAVPIVKPPFRVGLLSRLVP